MADRDDDLLTWLVARIDEDLDDDMLGLYELVWTVRGKVPEMETERAVAVSQRALDVVRAHRALEFFTLVWPGAIHEQELGADYRPRPGDWAAPGEAPYVAVQARS